MEAESSTLAEAAVAEVAPENRAAFVRAIWALAWPVILMMSLESIVDLLDMVMVGHLGAAPVAGVGIGTQILFAVNTVLIATSTGTLAIVARYVGAGETRRAEEVAMQSILAAAGIAAAVVVPVILWAPATVRAFGVEEEVVAVGSTYLRIVLLVAPFDAVLAVLAFALRGAGDTRTPLLISIVTGVIKVGLSFLLIFGMLGLPALGVAGAAIGTLVAFAMGSVLLAGLMASGRLGLRLHRQDIGVRPAVLRRLFIIAYPAAFEHIFMQFGFFLYFYFAAKYSTSAVAAYVIGVRILGLSFLPGFGFAAAASTVVGQSLGAHRPQRATRAGWETVRLALYMMTAAGVVIFALARPIAQLFVNDVDVIEKTVTFIRVLAAAQPLMAIDFTLGGALRGSGDTRFPLLAVVLGFYICRLGSAWIATEWLQLSLLWLWLALVPDYIARCVLKGARFRSERWQTIRV